VVPVIAASLLGGALAADDRSSLRLMVSQPICGGLLAGLVLGSPREGFVAGALLQMMFLGVIPVRGFELPDLPLAGVAAGSLSVLASRTSTAGPEASGLILFLSLAAGLVVAVAGRSVHRLWERRSYALARVAGRLAGKGRFGLAGALHFSSIAVHAAVGFALVALALLAGVPAIAAAGRLLAGRWCEPLRSLPALLPFIGAGALLLLNASRVRLVLFLAGFCAVFLVMFFRG
jgi:mannose/fructose/N-acetylgalactosamine-specific phosphotransferase system component IIC